MLNLNKVINGDQRAHFDLQLVAYDSRESHHDTLIFSHTKINQNIDLNGLIRYHLNTSKASKFLRANSKIGRILHTTGILAHDDRGVLWLKNLHLDYIALSESPVKQLSLHPQNIQARMKLYINSHQSQALKSYLDYGHKRGN